jgi:hypothetical protein
MKGTLPNIRLLSIYWTPVGSFTVNGGEFKEERMLVIDRAEVVQRPPGGKNDSPYTPINFLNTTIFFFHSSV